MKSARRWGYTGFLLLAYACGGSQEGDLADSDTGADARTVGFGGSPRFDAGGRGGADGAVADASSGEAEAGEGSALRDASTDWDETGEGGASGLAADGSDGRGGTENGGANGQGGAQPISGAGGQAFDASVSAGGMAGMGGSSHAGGVAGAGALETGGGPIEAGGSGGQGAHQGLGGQVDASLDDASTGAAGGSAGSAVTGSGGGGSAWIDGAADAEPDAEPEDANADADARSTIDAPAPASITLADFGDHQVIQRILGGNSQMVTVHGTFTGAAIADIEAEVVDFSTGATEIVPWTTLAGDSGGAYSGPLSIPQGGWYKLVVRGLDSGHTEVARASGTHRFGVGMNILCIGQSNMSGYGGTTVTPTVDLAGLYSNSHTWKHLADPYDSGGSASDVDFDSGTGASMIPSLVNTLASFFPGLPIGVVPAAKGSTPLACPSVDAGEPSCWGFRNASDPADTANLYGNSIAKARQAGGVELIVMHQGETDATNETPGPEYKADLELLASNYRADLADIPIFMCQIGRCPRPASERNRTDQTVQPIRVAQHDSDHPPQVYLAATAIDVEVQSDDHYTKAGYDQVGERVAGAIAFHYQASGAPSAYRGPEIASASYADEGEDAGAKSGIDIHITRRGGDDITPASGINGFTVLDQGVPVTINSVTRKDAATIHISLAAPIAGTGSVRYLYGKLPVQNLTGTVHDNSRFALPLEPTTNDLMLP